MRALSRLRRKRLHHTPAFVCSHVFQRARPVLLVQRDRQDQWQLLCGEGHDDGPTMVGLLHLLDADPSLLELLEMPRGSRAQRSGAGAPWVIAPIV